ncbi:MAG TPA: hypothetical protein VNE38_12930 [Ktedonobacteraceae bacterium]|nr:hypothetical protein [Ktedonobacteraceae bacterium]
MNIRLLKLMDSPDGWGHIQGRQVYEKLRALVEDHSSVEIFRISFDGVKRTDISFPRESVVELARSYRGLLGFCIINANDQDLLDNWDAAASKREQPLMVWGKNGIDRILGPQPGTGLREMFKYVISVPIARTSEAATALGLKVPNASNKLKQLWLEGYILRREQSASSGGVEYEYIRIG